MSNIINVLKENYKQLEKSIVAQLFLEAPNHQLTTGTYREKVWESLFKQILPKKFSIEQGVFIIDSKGSVSKEVDLAIFDEQYTPYIFNYGNIKFIPIEAVAMVVQCKSHSIDNADLNEWTACIDCLKTSSLSTVRMFQGIVEGDLSLKKEGDKTTQTSTRPIKVLCHIKKTNTEQTKVRKNLFDFILCGEENNQLSIFANEERTLGDWYEALNHADKECEKYIKECKNTKTLKDFEVGNNSILSLIFQLNQLLMLINNPMLFPHKAYVDLFDPKKKNR